MANIQDHPNALLLVEGNDDFHVMHALCKQFDIPVRNREIPNGGKFSIKDCKGIEKLLEQIPILFKSANPMNTLGIIIDADTDLASRWQSASTIFKKMGFVLPEELPKSGLIAENGDLKIGVWIMPNNNLSGMLEDFMVFLAPKNDPLLPILNETLNDIEAKALNHYALIHKPKALIHAWLALQSDPGSPLAQGITKHYLDTDQETCKMLIDWINRLFQP